mmetsp:Transcript_14404/g.42039  ORF Transcript_14404/g.42039 Transcript_14404/m.42039 type:complete len:201 (+) Transcript_14404:603-1205(+)
MRLRPRAADRGGVRLGACSASPAPDALIWALRAAARVAHVPRGSCLWSWKLSGTSCQCSTFCFSLQPNMEVREFDCTLEPRGAGSMPRAAAMLASWGKEKPRSSSSSCTSGPAFQYLPMEKNTKEKRSPWKASTSCARLPSKTTRLWEMSNVTLSSSRKASRDPDLSSSGQYTSRPPLNLPNALIMEGPWLFPSRWRLAA